MSRVYRGPWQDTAQAAINEALAEVKVSPGEYVECQYSDGSSRFVPLDKTRPSIDADVLWSEARQQYKAVLRKV